MGEKKQRRISALSHVLVMIVVIVVLLSMPMSSLAEEPKKISRQQEQTASHQKLDSIKQARHKAAKRQRRITFNNDGNDVTHFLDEATPEAMLQIRSAGLLDTQVDTIVYNTGYCFGHVLHRTKVGASFTCLRSK